MEFKFDLVDNKTPDVVIRESLTEIEEATKSYVKGNINPYQGSISSYVKKGLGSVLSLQLEAEKKVDIQDSLGEVGYKRNRFEVFLTVKGLEYYKYRMFFVDYGAISYPVTIVMNEELAVEYSGRRNDTYTIDSMKNLEIMLDKIIHSETMLVLLQNLINEAIRQENKIITTDLETGTENEEEN